MPGMKGGPVRGSLMRNRWPDMSSRPRRCPNRTAVRTSGGSSRYGLPAAGDHWDGTHLHVVPSTVARVLIKHTRGAAGWRAWTSALRARPRGAPSTTNRTVPATWSVWTSRSSGASGMAAYVPPLDMQRATGFRHAGVASAYLHYAFDGSSRPAYSEIPKHEKGKPLQPPGAKQLTSSPPPNHRKAVLTGNAV